MPQEGWCDRCMYKTDNILKCGRCGVAVYCSQSCQKEDWPAHKQICEPAPKPAKPKPKPPATAGYVAEAKKQDDDVDDDIEAEPVEPADVFRKRLLQAAQSANVRMVGTMQETAGVFEKYLPKLQELKADYSSEIRDRLRERDRVMAKEAQRKKDKQRKEGAEASTAKAEADESAIDYDARAASVSGELMGEVIRACLQRGIDAKVKNYQVDLANNHFQQGIRELRPPSSLALPKDQVEGFEDACVRVCDGGFCCADGLFDDDMAEAMVKDFEQLWQLRAQGSLCETRGTKGGLGCWLPFPLRKGLSSELVDMVTVLLGLPNELQRAGYPKKLIMSSMAYVGCMPPGATEPLHLDISEEGRLFKPEITLVLFCNPGWKKEDGGAFNAYLKKGGACDPDAGERLRKGSADKAQADGGSAVDEAAEDEDKPNVFYPEAGRCLIFRSRECWHEVLASQRRSWALTVFVGSEEK
eukprot:TRINITY_DN34994_c0_g1_i1.p1 TRINITY_DN34994_c0_g1~~TRINITY_DN34994_c0_g1_i1.p1  ORF type:complete len:470 (-),score=114.56 TRINITY_DN34994_c0_g1_i1:126-1535(-)